MTDRLRAALAGSDGVRVVPYVMAGFPSAEASVAMGRSFIEAGGAAIEVGIPFSDPLADGPVIQKVGHQALQAGMTVRGSIAVARGIAEAGAPTVLMTYLNPVLSYGIDRFAADIAEAGVEGVIIPDLPVDEAAGFVEPFRDAGVDTVFLAAPTSTDRRIEEIGRLSRGFVYCVSVTGVTGVRRALGDDVFELLDRVRTQTTLPVGVGFGISEAAHVARLRGHVEAAVCASALLRLALEDRDPVPLLRDMVAAGA